MSDTGLNLVQIFLFIQTVIRGYPYGCLMDSFLELVKLNKKKTDRRLHKFKQWLNDEAEQSFLSQ